jgi:putative flippase GtrA
MTFITVEILGGSIGIFFSLLLGTILTYVSIIKASSNLKRKLLIKTVILVWGGIFILLAVPLWLSYNKLLPEWTYWAGVGSFLIVFIPFISNYYKKRKNSIKTVSK